MRFDPSSRFVDPKGSNAGSGGHFGSGSASLNADYRGSKVSEPVRGGYDNHARRFERPPPSSVSATAGAAVITRRVVQEISSVRRDTRLPPPSPPPPPRDRLDDRRVVDRGRDERYVTTKCVNLIFHLKMQLHSVLLYLCGGSAIYQLAKLKTILFLACNKF